MALSSDTTKHLPLCTTKIGPITGSFFSITTGVVTLCNVLGNGTGLGYKTTKSALANALLVSKNITSNLFTQPTLFIALNFFNLYDAFMELFWLRCNLVLVGIFGAPFLPTNSGQIKNQSLGRKSHRLIFDFVSISGASRINLSSGSFCIFRHSETDAEAI